MKHLQGGLGIIQCSIGSRLLNLEVVAGNRKFHIAIAATMR